MPGEPGFVQALVWLTPGETRAFKRRIDVVTRDAAEAALVGLGNQRLKAADLGLQRIGNLEAFARGDLEFRHCLPRASTEPGPSCQPAPDLPPNPTLKEIGLRILDQTTNGTKVPGWLDVIVE